ncbi:hypothetical protein D3C73_1668780 [compost metagenome]
MHLLTHLIAALDQPLLDHRQHYIAEPLVEGTVIGKADLLAEARLELIGQLGRIVGNFLRL